MERKRELAKSKRLASGDSDQEEIRTFVWLVLFTAADEGDAPPLSRILTSVLLDHLRHSTTASFLLRSSFLPGVSCHKISISSDFYSQIILVLF